jgi:hypothetical protein
MMMCQARYLKSARTVARPALRADRRSPKVAEQTSILVSSDPVHPTLAPSPRRAACYSTISGQTISKPSSGLARSGRSEPTPTRLA